jgi:nucleotide-binding universal stress UspA family protein
VTKDREVPVTGRIVVGVDGSEGSRRALAWALKEATVHGSALEAVIVWQSPYGFLRDADFSYPVDEAVLADSASARLSEIIGEVAGERAADVIAQIVLEGDPAEVLCKRAVESDLLVVGARGHGTFAGLLLGSVSDKCAHHSPSPVVIVPADRGGRT